MLRSKTLSTNPMVLESFVPAPRRDGGQSPRTGRRTGRGPSVARGRERRGARKVPGPGPPRHFLLSFLGFSIVTNYRTYTLYLLSTTKATTNLVQRCEDVPKRFSFPLNSELAIRPSPPILMRWPWPQVRLLCGDSRGRFAAVEEGAIAPVPRISTKSGPFSPGEWLESLPGSARGY